MVYQRETLRPKKDLSIRENSYYLIYEARLKEELSIEHIIQYSTIRWQHNDKRSRRMAREYYGITSYERHGNITASRLMKGTGILRHHVI
jgi:hypothetical protein